MARVVVKEAHSPMEVKVGSEAKWICMCGLSKNQPFCDGSHKGTGFAPRKTELTERQTVAWCACKHSKNAPFCDGSHKTV